VLTILNILSADLTERKPAVNGENIQHEPVATDTSISQKNDPSAEVQIPSAASNDSTRRYPQRSKSKPKYLNDYVLKDDSVNVTMHYCYKMCDMPVTYSEAISSPDSQNWKCAMKEKMDSLRWILC